MQVRFSLQAEADLREAYDFIAKDNPDAADRVLEAISGAVARLASGSFQGRELRLQDGRKLRTWVIPPYRLFYRIRDDVFEVVRIHHSARRPL